MNIKHNREEVLNTGLNLLCARGYNSLGVDEICSTTGMTKGAFYNAYQSKENFLLEAIKSYGINNVARIQRELNGNTNQSPLFRLQQFYSNMLQAQPRLNFGGCFINNIMAELGQHNPLVAQASQHEYNKFIEAITPTVVEAQLQGELNTESTAPQLAELMHSTFYGVLTIAKSRQDNTLALNTMNQLFQLLKTNKYGKKNHI